MLNKEIIQRTQSAYSHGVQSDDSRLSNRHIFNTASSIRARLLTQEAKKNQRISDWAYQMLECVELIKAPLNECPCTPQSGCTILRSRHKIPSPMVTASKTMIIVTGLEGRLTITETTFETMKFAKGRRFTKTSPEFFIKNGYIYITANLILETIVIKGLFNDTIAAWKFPSVCNPQGISPCMSNLDYEFPYEDDLVDALVQLAAQELIQLFGNSREDKKNNTSDDSQP